MRTFLTLCFTAMILLFATTASAQTAPDIIITPDELTGEVTARMATNTTDARYTRTCVFRIDNNSPDPNAEVACVDFRTNGIPATAPFIGLEDSITFPVVIVTGEDQLYVAKNFVDIGGGAEISSVRSTNSGLIPGPVAGPVFIVSGG